MSKVNSASGKVHKSTKGIPRVTDKVLAMDEAGRASWLAEKGKGLSAEVIAEIKARIEKIMKGGRQGKSKKVDFAATFSGKTVEELTEAQTALTSALATAAVEAESKINAEIASLEAQKETLAKARASMAAQKA